VKESKHAKEALVEARMETEAIEVEKKQLMQNWTSCLIGMKRRDEAYSQMNDAIKLEEYFKIGLFYKNFINIFQSSTSKV
jgi:hypothetical protein